MSSQTDNNKRIAKNSILLYIRMMFVMVVSLFTSRVVLNSLGVTDFGIYNVVGGFVSLFTILSGSFSAAISRFITFELGKKDTKRLALIFSTSMNVQFVISLMVIILSEIIGIWFLNYKMNIPLDRINAANWVLQCSIIIFVINLISVPYNATIIAHENMGAYAVISIIDAFLKLLIAYLLYVSPIDRLVYYSILSVIIAVIIRVTYMVYCRKYNECKYQFSVDRTLLKEMGKFAGWNLMGSSALVINTQGVNLLMNLFFGVITNAARGLATQVDSAVRAFTNSFMTAINPQITKSYAAGDLGYVYLLICRGAKFSAFLFIIFAVPLFLEMPFVLKIWLRSFPEEAIIFSKLALFAVFVDSVLGNSSWAAIMATGDIKKYQVYVSILGIMVFPLTWLLYQIGGSPESTYYVFIIIYSVILFVRLFFVKVQVGMPPVSFLKKVLVPVLPVFIGSLLTASSVQYFLDEGWMRFICVIMISLFVTSILVYTIGLTVSERKKVTSKIRSLFIPMQK